MGVEDEIDEGRRVDFLYMHDEPDPRAALRRAATKGSSPSTAAKAYNDSNRIGVPYSAAEAEPEMAGLEARRVKAEDDYRSILEADNPAVGDWIAKEDVNADLAFNDVDVLTRIAEYTGVSQIPAAFDSQVAALGLRAHVDYKIAVARGERLVDQEREGRIAALQERQSAWQFEVSGDKVFGIIANQIPIFGQVALGAVEGLTAGLAVTAATGGVLAPSIPFSVTAGMIRRNYDMEFSNAYFQLIDVRDENGDALSHEDIVMGARLYAALSAALETWATKAGVKAGASAIHSVGGAKSIIQRLIPAAMKDPAKRAAIPAILRAAGESSGAEFFTEATQALSMTSVEEGLKLWQDDARDGFYDYGLEDAYEVFRDPGTWLAIAKEGLAGAIAGGGTTSAFSAVGISIDKFNQGTSILHKSLESDTKERQLDRIDELVRESELAKLAPEKFQEVLEESSTEENVTHVHAQGVVDLFQGESQPAGVTIEQASEALGVTVEELQDAAALDEDIVVPLHLLASKIAGTPLHKVMKVHARNTPDGITSAQRGENAKLIAGVIEEIREEQATRDQAEDGTANAETSDRLAAFELIRDQTEAGLIASGVSKSAARDMAIFDAAAKVNLAERGGVDPLDLFGSSKIRAATSPVPSNQASALAQSGGGTFSFRAPDGSVAEAAIDSVVYDTESGEGQITAKVNGVAVGILDFVERANDVLVTNIETGADVQRRGIASQMMNRLRFDHPGETITVEGGNEDSDAFFGSVESRTGSLAIDDPSGLQPSDMSNPNRVSTRRPSTKESNRFHPDVDNGALVVDLESQLRAPKNFARNMKLLRTYAPIPRVRGESDADFARRFVAHIKSNLLNAHDSMDPSQRERAKNWYSGARKIADAWSRRFGLPPDQIAGAMAVLSPQKDWFQNASLAERTIVIWQGQQDTTFGPEMLSKAGDIMAGYLKSNEKPNGTSQKTIDKFNLLVSAVDGLTLAEAAEQSDEHAAAWVRMYDETFNDKGFRIITPEGGFGGFSKNDDGSTNSKVAWGSYAEIGKAISIIRNPTKENINEQLGNGHKVRNFFNNILTPDAGSDVTIDTHAVAIAMMMPYAAKALAVGHNFGSAKGSSKNGDLGIAGVYALYAQAYREAAAERQLLPREMQSITWEAARVLFPDKKKSAKSLKAAEKVWDSYASGRITLDQAREQIYESAGKLGQPEWVGSDSRGVAEAGASTYAGELSGVVEPGSGPVAGVGRGDGSFAAAESAVQRDVRDEGGAAASGAGSSAFLAQSPSPDEDQSRRQSLIEFRRSVQQRDAEGDAGPTGPFRRGDAGAAQALGFLSEGVQATLHSPEPDTRAGFAKLGLPAPDLYEVSGTEAAQFFRDSIQAGKEANRFGASVYVYDVEEYAAMRLFVTSDGTAGAALKGNDFVSLFIAADSPHRGAAPSMQMLSIQEGGEKSDAFDTVLPGMYADMGLRVVARMAWSDEFAPPDWDHSVFSKYNDGRPDVVYMVYDPDYVGPYLGTEGVVVNDPDEAEAIQAEEIRRMKEGEPRAVTLSQGAAVKTDTEEFKAYFEGSKVLDENGEPLVIYHATTHDFDEFSLDNSNANNDLGRGFYATSSAGDANVNYAGFGADLSRRIEDRAESLIDQEFGTLSTEDAHARAREEIAGEHEGAVMPVYMAIKNPVVIGVQAHKAPETYFEFNIEYNEDGDVISESGTAIDLMEAIREVGYEFDEVDPDLLISEIFEDGGEEVSASDVLATFKNSDSSAYASDYDNDLSVIPGEFFKQVMEKMGFDGIIDSTVGDKFRNMDGVFPDTVHFVAFEPGQIKSVHNRGTFDPNDPKILNQPSSVGPPGEASRTDRGSIRFNPEGGGEITFYPGMDNSTFLHESAHLYLHTMAYLAGQGGAMDELVLDYGRISNWLVESADKIYAWIEDESKRDGSRITPEMFEDVKRARGASFVRVQAKAMAIGLSEQSTPENTVAIAMHEYFARGFETYLSAGKAPNEALKGPFRNFKAWLREIYTDVKKALGVNLSDEITGVMERMISSRQEIAQVNAQNGGGIIESLVTALGWTDTERAAYEQQAIAIEEEADEEIMADVKKAQARKIKRKNSEHYKTVFRQIREALKETREYQAHHWLQTNGEWLTEPVLDGPIDAAGGVKLNRQMVEELLGNFEDWAGIVAGLGRGKGALWTKGGGSDPREVAALFKFASAREMILALSRLKPIGKATKELADAQIQREEEILGTEEDQIEKAVADVLASGGAKIKMLEFELSQMKRLRRRNRNPINTAADRQIAEEGAPTAEGARTLVAEAQKRLEAAREAQDEDLIRQRGIELESAVAAQEAGVLARRAESARRRGVASARRQVREISKLLKAAAVEEIEGTANVDVRPGIHRAAEARARKDIERAIAEHNMDEVESAMRRRLYHAHAERAALNAKSETKKGVNYLNRFKKKRVREAVQKADREGADHWKQIVRLLASVDTRNLSKKNLDLIRADQNILAYKQGRETEGAETSSIDDRFGEDGAIQNFKLMSVQDFRSLVNSVKNIERIARDEATIQDGTRRVDFNDAMDQLSGSIKDNGVKAKPLKKDPSLRDDLRKKLRGLDSNFLKIEQVVEWLDGGDIGGIARRMLFTPAAEAQALELDMHKEFTVKITKAMGDLTTSNQNFFKRQFTFSFVGNEDADGNFVQESVSGEWVISVALNLGNISNREKLMEGYGWTEEQLKEILTNLSDTQWDAVQTVWDSVGSIWGKVEALYKRLTGVAPGRVEALPFITPGGKEMRGGYYPVVYDPEPSVSNAIDDEGNRLTAPPNAIDAITNEFATLFPGAESNFIKYSTSNSYTKGRTKYKGPLLLSTSLIPKHIAQVIHDVTHREFVRDAWKVVSDNRFRDAISEVLGSQYANMFKPWLLAISNQGKAMDPTGATEVSTVISKLRHNTIIMGLGLRATTALLQPLGFAESKAVIGEGPWLSQAVAKFANAGGPSEIIKLVEEIKAKSAEMRHRFGLYDADIGAAMDGLKGEEGWTKWIQRLSLQHIGYMDLLVSYPTWEAGYQKALAQGHGEDIAIVAGDAAVRQSQGAGGMKDQSAAQRDPGILRLLTMFYSYHAAKYSRFRNVAHEARLKKEGAVDPKDALFFASQYLWLGLVPSTMQALFFGELPDTEDDETDEEIALTYAKWALGHSLAEPLSTIPGVRDAMSTFVRGYDYQLSPVSTAGKSIARLLDFAFDSLADPASFEDPGVQYKAVEIGSKAAGYLLGMPVSQAYLTINQMADVANGDVPFDPFDIFFRRRDREFFQFEPFE